MKKKLLAGLATGVFIVGMAGLSSATTLNVEKRDGIPYQVLGTESASDLITAFNSMTFVSSTNVTQFVSIFPDNGTLLTLNFDLAVSSIWDFRIGPDWGTGGGVISDNSLVALVVDDRWWANNWDASGEVVTTENFTLGAGQHTIQWLGFENCCSGGMTVQFKPDAANAWSNLSLIAFDNALPAAPVPEPATMLLLGTGLVGLVGARRKKKA